MEIDFREIRQLQNSLASAAGGGFHRGMRRAFSTVVRSSKTVVKREIVKQYNLSQKRAGDGLRSGLMDHTNLRFSIYGDRNPVGLASFSGTSQTKKGVGARIKKGGARKLYPSAWLGHGLAGATTAKGGRLALQRVPGAAKRTTSRGRYAGTGIMRQPIRALHGPSVGAMLESNQTVDSLLTFAAGKYETELVRQIKVALRG